VCLGAKARAKSQWAGQANQGRLWLVGRNSGGDGESDGDEDKSGTACQWR
jgi:hypothetical protein